eukprot:48385-Rhodomonas_salina.1
MGPGYPPPLPCHAMPGTHIQRVPEGTPQLRPPPEFLSRGSPIPSLRTRHPPPKRTARGTVLAQVSLPPTYLLCGARYWPTRVLWEVRY